MKDMDMQTTAPVAIADDGKMWIRPVLAVSAANDTAFAVGGLDDGSGLS